MKSQTITIIVPRLPPAIDGLGDYGLKLAIQMRQEYGIQAEFIVADPRWCDDLLTEEFKVRKILSRTSKALLKLLPINNNIPQTVVLHYVGYGYAKRGCPFWLIRALEKWRYASRENNLITMFHELYAFGPIWTSQFWTFPAQRSLVARLAYLSDKILTSKRTYSDIIFKLTQGKHSSVPVIPVFSNVGEPNSILPIAVRARRVVIFGGRSARSRVYLDSREFLLKTCIKFNITEIVDIGPTLTFDISPMNGITIKILGIKGSKEISDILSNSMIGFINYPIDYLTKSGIFAAYCSHGLLTVIDSGCGRSLRGENLIENFHYMTNLTSSSDLEEMQVVSDNALRWYKEHNLSIHSQTFYKYF